MSGAHTCSKGDGSTNAGKCKACRAIANAAYRAKRSGGGKVTSRARAKSPPASVSQAAPAALKLEAAWGLEAYLEDGYLHVKQCDAEGNADELMLSRGELRALIAEFLAWAGA